MEIDETRTGLIKLLLRFSESIDSNDTSFKREMYNVILSKLKYEDVSKMKNIEGNILLEGIIVMVSNHWNIQEDFNDIKTREREFIEPIYVAMTMAMDNTKLSLASIGGKFNGRDHSTVLHAHKTIDNLIDTDKVFRLKFQNALKKLNLRYKKYEPNTYRNDD